MIHGDDILTQNVSFEDISSQSNGGESADQIPHFSIWSVEIEKSTAALTAGCQQYVVDAKLSTVSTETDVDVHFQSAPSSATATATEDRS